MWRADLSDFSGFIRLNAESSKNNLINAIKQSKLLSYRHCKHSQNAKQSAESSLRESLCDSWQSILLFDSMESLESFCDSVLFIKSAFFMDCFGDKSPRKDKEREASLRDKPLGLAWESTAESQRDSVFAMKSAGQIVLIPSLRSILKCCGNLYQNNPPKMQYRLENTQTHALFAKKCDSINANNFAESRRRKKVKNAESNAQSQRDSSDFIEAIDIMDFFGLPQLDFVKSRKDTLVEIPRKTLESHNDEKGTVSHALQGDSNNYKIITIPQSFTKQERFITKTTALSLLR